MQTTGAVLLAVKLPSSIRARMHAKDGRSAHGLLYPLLYGMTRACKTTVKAALTLTRLVTRFVTGRFAQGVSLHIPRSDALPGARG